MDVGQCAPIYAIFPEDWWFQILFPKLLVPKRLLNKPLIQGWPNLVHLVHNTCLQKSRYELLIHFWVVVQASGDILQIKLHLDDQEGLFHNRLEHTW